MFAGNYVPEGWANCDGQRMPMASYSGLYSLIGTTYGGDGFTYFQLPDLRGRSSIHPGQGPGLSQRRRGQIVGANRVYLTQQQMGAHNHTATLDPLKASTAAADVASPYQAVPAPGADPQFTPGGSGVAMARAMLGEATYQAAGGSRSNSVVPPVLGMRYIINLGGLYPALTPIEDDQ